MSRHPAMRAVIAVPLLALAPALAASSHAQEQPRPQRVTVGPEYAASGFHKAMLGASYRTLWTTPVELEVLDLSREAGGLKPVRRVGGQQTMGLALVAPDGRSYTFRAVDKDPSSILPEELHDTFVHDLLRDQMSAQHPAAALIADELANAAGVPTVPVRMVVMPDDPALGEFRESFKGLPGTLAEYPTAATAEHPGYQGATEIVDHMRMFEMLAASPDHRVAARELLRMRLFDVLISDFDRHRKQWRWLRRPGDALWHPLPEDRDQAFARYDGLLVRAAASYVPQIRRFGREYDSILGLTYNGREQDRWLLAGLEREAWRDEARALQAALTDDVFERAARRMPPEWYPLDGPRLVAALKARRDRLLEEAEIYYEHLAGEVDVQATDAAERLRVERAPDGSVTVELAGVETSGAASEPYFRRRFLKSETNEIRVYLRGGNDRVEMTGPEGGITVRVVGGAGDDVVADSGGGLRYYDSRGNNQVGEGTAWDRRPYSQPSGPPAAPWIPPRDWGRDYYFIPWASFGSDIGLFLGGGFTTAGYGFRKHPWADHQTLRAGWAFGAKQPRVDYRGEFRRANSDLRFALRTYWSGLEILRYYGFGNETSSAEDDDFYKVRQRQLVFAPGLILPIAGPVDLTLTPLVQYADTDDEEDSLVIRDAPYGSGSFGQVGGWARLRLDTRQALARAEGAKGRLPSIFGAAGYPVSGAYVEAIGAVFPKAWDVDETYGWIEGQAATFWSAGRQGRATLALRAGGKHMLGDRYPFHNAASVGGGGFFSGFDTVRGLRPNRFIGDSSAYGNAELRLYLSRFFLALPGEWGLFGFGDVGRVWLDGESSDKWHSSWGGGIWIGLLARSNAVALSWAKSDERTAFYIRAGFSF